MAHVRRALLTALILAATGPAAYAQDNPYRVDSEAWGELPAGRTWGALSAVYPAPDGRSMWVAERCGQNSCVGRDDVDPILHFDLEGNLLGSFGAGMIAWPHGIYVDRDGNVWIADAAGIGQMPDGAGHVIYKFSPTGELLMTLGQKGRTGSGPDLFHSPSDVLVAPNGDIFVADGHGAGNNNRIVKFAADGRFLMEWGSTGAEAGEFRDPHALAMDSQGRLFVGDRGNSRIQIFTQDGEHIATWTQFGRPSGLFIDGNDVLYATDSESNARRNPGWRRGIYIGSVTDGFVTAFIPDPEPDPDASGTSGAEGVAVDALGNIYGAEVGPETLRRYVLAAQDERMNFFLTSSGPGSGADLVGLAGADNHCSVLAANAGIAEVTWHAYLSATETDSTPAVNARDRIGAGPWYNHGGVMIAETIEQLHGENNINQATALTELGAMVNGRGDSPNQHDILTGSRPDGTAYPPGDDTTCSNWTSSGEGSARVGHFDRTGGGEAPTSWNSAHGSRGCGQEDLQGTGGNGYFYCFGL